MKNKKVRNGIIIAVIVLLLIAAVIAAVLLIKNGADPVDTSSPTADSVTSQESDVIGASDGDAAELAAGKFTNNDKSDQKYAEQGELGGSKTLGVTTPGGTSSNTSSETGSIERIDGIW